MRRRLLFMGIALALTGCGDDSASAPSPRPTPVQLAGVWNMTLTRTSVTGGECLEGAFNSTIGTPQLVSMSFAQNGASLNATSTTVASGVSCTWTGTADVDRFVLTQSSCQSAANQVGLRCANGAVRDMRIASSGMNATVSGAGYAGTKADTYNVFPSGGFTAVGQLVVNENVSMTK